MVATGTDASAAATKVNNGKLSIIIYNIEPILSGDYHNEAAALISENLSRSQKTRDTKPQTMNAKLFFD